MTPGALVYVAAYRPIRFYVWATPFSTELPIYADIYINSTYYKTLTCYTVDTLIGMGTYVVDIADALQEYLKTYTPQLPVNAIQDASYEQMVEVYVNFRASSFDPDGLLVPDGPVPVQGTVTTPPVSGGGLPSNSFFVINASLLPQFDNIMSNELETALQERMEQPTTVASGTRVYPLSNLPVQGGTPLANLSIGTYRDDYGGFPFIVMEFGPATGWWGGPLPATSRNCKLGMFYDVPGGGSSGVLWLTTGSALTSGIHYLPLGLKEIFAVIPGIYPPFLTNPAAPYHYQLFLWDNDAGQYVFFTPWFKFKTTAVERVRLAFQNTYGCFEYVTFLRNSESFKIESSEQLIPYVRPFSSTVDPINMGHRRNSIKANDEITLSGVFKEVHMPWFKELLMSPIVYMQVLKDAKTWDNPAGTTPALKQVKVVDGSYSTKKTVEEGRYAYEVSFKITPSIEYITLRN